MITKTIKHEMEHVLDKLRGVQSCLGHGSYNHEVVCHVPALVEIAQSYAIMLSELDKHGIVVVHGSAIDTFWMPMQQISTELMEEFLNKTDFRSVEDFPNSSDVVDLPSMEDVREVLGFTGRVVE